MNVEKRGKRCSFLSPDPNGTTAELVSDYSDRPSLNLLLPRQPLVIRIPSSINAIATVIVVPLLPLMALLRW
jgi:hypothetical protein